jgi:hypothetical protein
MRTAKDVEEIVRLAWHAEREGRPGVRDALLTLVVAEGGLDDAVLAERLRRLLIARRPDHWLASFPTVGQALGHPQVIAALDRLRATYPPTRVQRILLRGEAASGPYRQQRRPLSRVIDDLLGRPAEILTIPALPFPAAEPGGATPVDDDPASILIYYLSVLLAIAILLASVLPPAARETKAA